jgi:coenzyme F420-reducing hydrogenase beta subunit
MNKQICTENKCTGCSLCLNVCKQKAINITKGKIDTIYPTIDPTKCINCRLCYKYCPSLNHGNMQYPQEAIACWSKDDADYKTSTSGGAASVVSTWVLENNGIVYGCGTNKNKISHIRIDDIKDLWKLKGSKYTQSQITNNLYKQVKTDLSNGKLVVFIGTPCQVAACKAYNRKNEEKLITIDLICHGVPSQELFIKSLTQKLGINQVQEIRKISFRDCETSDFILSTIITDEDKKEYKYTINPFNPSFNDKYYCAFWFGWSYRESCYNCIYANNKRISDITIGDFWGLNVKELPIKPTAGCSVMLINTEKGHKVKEKVKDKLYAYNRPVEEAIKGNSQLQKSTRLTTRGKIFRTIYPYCGLNTSFNIVALDKVILSYIKKSIKFILFIK